jgi:hypothetical protein
MRGITMAFRNPLLAAALQGRGSSARSPLGAAAAAAPAPLSSSHRMALQEVGGLPGAAWSGGSEAGGGRSLSSLSAALQRASLAAREQQSREQALE